MKILDELIERLPPAPAWERIDGYPSGQDGSWQWLGRDVALTEKMLCPTEGRHGSGRNGRTVIHAITLRPIAEGRFSRQAKEFLCSQQGRRRFGVNGVTGHDCEVTCPVCAERINRYGLSIARGEAAARLVTLY